MRKALKITLRILAAVLLILLLLLFAVQFPPVQTFLAKKAVSALEKNIDGEISVGSVSIRPVNAVILKDVLIVDKHPCTDTAGTSLPVVDTFVRAGYIAATLSVKNLLSGGGVHIKRAVIKDAEFNLTTERDSLGESTSNLARIFHLAKNDDAPEDTGNLFDIDRYDIENFTFRLSNFGLARSYREEGRVIPKDAIDWNNLEIKADAKGRNLRFSHSIMSGTADKVRIREKSGYTAELSGFARVGVGETLIKGLRLKDSFSNLDIDRLQMSYKDISAFSNFLEDVRIRGDIKPSLLDMRSIRYFAPGLKGNTFRADIQGSVDGPVSDLQVSRIAFKDSGSQVSGMISGRVSGLPDVTGMKTDFEVKNLAFTSDGLGKLIHEWAPGVTVDLGKIAPGKTLTFNGKGKGPVNNVHIDGTLTSPALGEAVANLDIRHLLDPGKDMAIKGRIRTMDLDLGPIIGTDAVRQLTLETRLGATLAKKGPEVVIDSLRISRLNALGYDYSDIWATGTYSNEAFDGRIVCHDKNLNFILQGLFNLSSSTKNAAYQFYANVGYADLNALNIDKRGKSKVSFRTNADFMYVNKEDIIGDISVADLILENEDGRHDIGNISILSHSNDEVHRIRLNSSFADGTYLSSKSIFKMAKDIRNLTLDKELPALSGKDASLWDGTTYDLALNFHDSRDLLSFALPGLYIADSTAVRLKIASDGVLKGNVRSGRLAFGNNYVKRLSLELDNSGNGLVGTFTSPEINVAGIQFHENSGSLFAEDNRVGISYNYRNGDEDNGSVYLNGDFLRDEAGILSLTARALPSQITYDGKTWELHSDDICLKDKNLDIHQLRAFCEDQTLLVDGGLSPGKADTLTVRMEKFDLSIANSLIPMKMDIRGKATGKAFLISPSKPQPGMLVNLICDSTAIAGHPAGQIRLESSWNEEAKRFDILAKNDLDGHNNFDINGFFRPSDRNLDILAQMDGFNLGYAAPVLESVFSRTEGLLDGKFRLKGPLNKLDISSEDAAIRDGLLKIGFTNVAYRVSGPVSVDRDGLKFLNMDLTDGQKGKGTLSGGIRFHDLFQDPRLDVLVRMREMLALDLTGAMNSTFYGTVYGSGRVAVTGPFENVLINVDATTARQGDLHIPLGNSVSNKSMDLLTFTEEEKEVYIDPYDLMMQRFTSTRKKASDLGVKLRIRATPDVTAHVEIDKASGSGLTGQGSGTIEIETRTSNELFTINGDYTLTSGNFKFSALGIVNRDFTLQSGSSVRFNGDIMDSDLNIDGLYVTKASLANLLADETAATTRRTVNCGIKITDKLRNPQVKFSIDIPDIDPTTQALVSSALNTEDNIQKQFVYLLVANSFLPSEQSGIVNNSSSMLYSNVSSIMAGQLNNIFQKLDIPLDLGLNYESTEQGADIFDVALSTQLFNNRVIVNGTIGSRQYGTAGTTDEVVGDLDIDVKMNRPGTLRLNLFSHSADKYTNYLDNSQRSGAGIAYQREFDSFRQFVRELFAPKSKREERSGQYMGSRMVTLQIDSTGKANPINDNE